MPGPKRKARWVQKTDATEGNQWICNLECGHIVTRPVRRRRGHMGQRVEDPVPTWVYCEKCHKDGE